MKLFRQNRTAGVAAVACLGIGLTAVLYFVRDASVHSSGSSDSARLQAPEMLSEIIDGSMAFTFEGDVYKVDIGSREPTLLVKDGSYPRWSPDGAFIAFVRGNSIMRVRSDGANEEKLAAASEARAVAYHPKGSHVLFTDKKAVRSVELQTGTVETVLEGWTVRELDVSSDGRRLAATVRRAGYHVYVFDLETGESKRLARGCSANMSPDGRLVSLNKSGHRVLGFLSSESGEASGAIHALPDRRFDNHSWSNEQDWMVCVSEEDAQNVFAHRISTDEAFQLTFRGNCNRPDLYVQP